MNIQTDNDNRKLRMHYWYMDELGKNDKKGVILHGIVTGHRSIADSTFIHTSRVQKTYIDKDNHELIVETSNNIYYCPLSYCEFAKQDERKDLIPDYEHIKEKYIGKIEHPLIEAGNVLLVLSNFDNYYFHSLYCVPASGFAPLSYHASTFNSSLQDDFMIQTEDHRIELRYFPHFQNVEFITQETNEMPLYIENIGDISLYIKARCGIIELLPGQRKLVCRENSQSRDMTMTLPANDLFADDLLE